jgi:O-antigen biosynthesis protein WbqV
VGASLATVEAWMAKLEQALAKEDREAVFRVLGDAVPDFRGKVA